MNPRHRGFRAAAPENTAPAFREAGKAGYAAAECDIYRAKDGVWVVQHDRSTYRMMDKSMFVEKATYEELKDATTDNGVNIDQYPDLKICTLKKFLQICQKYNMQAVIELKEENKQEIYDGQAELEEARKELVDSQEELAQKQQELEDSKKELQDSRQKLADGRAELNDKKIQLENGKNELNSKKEATQQQLAEAETKLLTAKTQAEAAKTHLQLEIQTAQAVVDGYEQVQSAAAGARKYRDYASGKCSTGSRNDMGRFAIRYTGWDYGTFAGSRDIDRF